ncbi:MAG: anthranilate phosphoribosyltransferase [Puniceicoccales bacterium]|jgi:anthranilate phosphoribosyltransferase|nr:anthranilate phosphoribosyltransferase [Puniceicoccales bacterium]
MIKKLLNEKLLNGKNLTREESFNLFSRLSECPPEQQAAIIALLRAKHESTEEILGALDCFTTKTLAIKDPSIPPNVIDIVGTGGDCMGTFNISTTASIVISSCGVSVAKHGSKSWTSKSGSMDFVESLGIKFPETAEDVLRSLAAHNCAFLFASIFNGEFKKYGALICGIKMSTIFNICGPLMNPVNPKRQVVGVYRKDLVRTIAEVMKMRNFSHALVVHSADGLDELSVSAVSNVAEVSNGTIREYTVNPRDLGIAPSELSEIIGGNADQNRQIAIGILSGEITGAKLDIVALNSAAGLYVAGAVKTLKDGVKMARDAISSGQAMKQLNALRNGGTL